MPDQFTAAEKLACALREVGKRKHVYANLVSSGRMTQQQMDREIACMEEIADDYRKKAENERLI